MNAAHLDRSKMCEKFSIQFWVQIHTRNNAYYNFTYNFFWIQFWYRGQFSICNRHSSCCLWNQTSFNSQSTKSLMYFFYTKSYDVLKICKIFCLHNLFWFCYCASFTKLTQEKYKTWDLKFCSQYLKFRAKFKHFRVSPMKTSFIHLLLCLIFVM